MNYHPDEDMSQEEFEHWEWMANSTECEECQGEGRVRFMVCYGGMPTEVQEYCEECGGEGRIPND